MEGTYKSIGTLIIHSEYFLSPVASRHLPHAPRPVHPSVSSPDTTDPLMSSSLNISDPLMGGTAFSPLHFTLTLFFSEHHKVYLANILYQLYLTQFDITLKQDLWKGCDSSAEQPLCMWALSQASHMMMLVSHMSTIQILFCCPLVVTCTCSSITRFTKESRYACPHLNFILHLWRVGLAPDGSSVAVNGTMERAAFFLPYLMMEYINSAQCLLFQHSLKSVVSSLPFV